MRIRNKYSNLHQDYRFAYFYFGLNCTWQEFREPKVIKMPLPFLKKDISIIRYKKVIYPNNVSIVELRLDDVIRKLQVSPSETDLQAELKKTILSVLNQVKNGVYRI